MSSTHIYKLDPLSQYDSVQIHLFKNVKNLKALLQKAKSGDLKCALLNPRLIFDPFQIVVAANKAAISLRNGKMITRNIYSEIVYNLSPTRNISKSLETFGIGNKHDSEDGVNTIVCILHEKDSPSTLKETLNDIDGNISSGDICELKDMDYITKIYGVTYNHLQRIITMCAVKH